MVKDDMIRQLRCVLPYPIHWYERKTEKQIRAIHLKNLAKIALFAIQRDEDEVRARQGLPPIERHIQSEQLTLF